MGFIVHRAAGGHTLLRQIAGDTLRIGRDAGAELRLDDDAVALDHAVIRGGDGVWTLDDRGSVTGTYLGGRRVSSAQLAAGDVIEIGGFRIRVQITHPEDPLFVHVAAVGAGAAESPRPARGSSTGSLRLDELVARARETGRRPPPSADTGPLRRLAEIAAAAATREPPKAPPGRRPSTDTGPLRRLGELAAEVEGEPAEAAGGGERSETAVGTEIVATAAAEAETAAIRIPPAAAPGRVAARSREEPEAETAPPAGERGVEGEDRVPPTSERRAETGATAPAQAAEGESAAGEPETETAAVVVAAGIGSAPDTGAPEGPPEVEPEAERSPAEPSAPEAAVPAAAPDPPAAASPVPAAAPPRIDYAAAYSLRRPGLTKGLATLLATVAAVVAVAALGAAGSRTWLMPGISSAHARIVGAEAETPQGPPAAGAGGSAAPAAPGATPPAAPPITGGGAGAAGGAGGGAPPPGGGGGPVAASLAARRGEVAELGCRACHSPWRGPAAVEGCAACHPRQAGPHAVPLAGSAAVPACAACHPEHRDRPLVAANDERPCLACHRDLDALATAAEPAVARRVTSFAAEHPELVVALPAPGGGVTRLRLDDPAARAADPAVLRFGHRFHQAHEEGEATGGPPLKPTTGLGPARIEELTRCAACHQPDPATGLMQPVAFERHCQACHALVFEDERFPDCQVPHEPADDVEGFLLLAFIEGECPGAEAGGGEGGGPSRRARRIGEWKRRLRTIGDDDPRRRGFQDRAGRAMDKLFRADCRHCHTVDLDEYAVEPTAIPAVWMPGARFSHLDHEGVACAECHAGAAASERTADVLLPGIAACRSCHGEDRDHPQASRLLSCGECHDYHPATATEAPRVALRIP